MEVRNVSETKRVRGSLNVCVLGCLRTTGLSCPAPIYESFHGFRNPISTATERAFHRWDLDYLEGSARPTAATVSAALAHGVRGVTGAAGTVSDGNMASVATEECGRLCRRSKAKARARDFVEERRAVAKASRPIRRAINSTGQLSF